MGFALLVHEETPGRPLEPALTLVFVRRRVTAREVLERRVSLEVEMQNRQRGCELDGSAQVAATLDAFAHQRLLMLAGDRQVETLDDEIDLDDVPSVTLVRLVALAGG